MGPGLRARCSSCSDLISEAHQIAAAGCPYFTVSRQIRGAVKRNRARRRLREAYRHRTVSNLPDISTILIARPPVLTTTFAGLVLAVDDVLRQLGRAVGR